MTFAILPFSNEPTRSPAPAILAASIVSARKAASAERPSLNRARDVPHEIARLDCRPAPENANGTPAAASAPAVFRRARTKPQLANGLLRVGGQGARSDGIVHPEITVPFGRLQFRGGQIRFDRRQ